MQLDLTSFSVTGAVILRMNDWNKEKILNIQSPPQNRAHAKELQLLLLSKTKNPVVSNLRASRWSRMLHPQEHISFFGFVTNGAWEAPADGFSSVNWSSPLCHLAMVWKTKMELYIAVLDISLKWICIAEF